MLAIRSGSWVVLAAVVAMLGSTGCASLGANGLGGILGDDPQAVAADPGSTYQVVFVPTNGKAEGVQRTLSGQMHVQQALEQVGAAKKFRRIQVELMRPLPSGGVHRIACEYDRGSKRVTPEFDYALLPGDRIIVKEDPTNLIDDMLGSALGPIGTKLSGKMHARGEGDSRYQVVK